MEHCERYTPLLSARLDGELTPEEERELEAHLAVCPACRALGSRLAAIHSAFPELEKVAAPEGFARGVMDRVRASESAKPKVIPLFRRPQFKALAGMAACLALCLGVYQAGLPGQSRKDAAQMMTAADLQTAEAEQPAAAAAPSLFAADTDAGEEKAKIPDSVPQSRGAEQSPQEKDGETFDQTTVLTGAGEQPQDGAVNGAAAVQSQMGFAQEIASDYYTFENARYLRVSYGRTPQAPSAQILGSADSLTAFLVQFPGDDLSQVSSDYGEEFFAGHRLLAIVVEEGSGSVRHEIAPQGLERDRVTVLCQTPGEGTDDMAAWLILAEVDGSFRDGDVLAVMFEEQS
ncbi:anti-sigma factor family protein [Pseudoflavonifractor phocaeensis]|uniref:anti-sigma factor family protein n=1 Tax=Pseudoflavonifractor phocaeensis TaxID=1870988 RepID=UPI001F1E2350|nr:zf-HC2 domain-containing protein [Pseudoflavonifractor phocaeensis]MCF2661710.1 zf-HC2 domain-containing protein [Pseudoflavonifractor phocaeensis]